MGGLRVLTITNLYPPDVIGGYELGCRQMVDELRGRGHEVSVLTTAPRWPIDDPPWVCREMRLVEWQLRHDRPAMPLQWERSMEAQSHHVDAANVATVLRHLESFRPDVVYLWNVAQAGAYGIVAALAHLQVPTVWHLMDSVPRVACTVGGTPVAAAARLLSRRLRVRYLVCSQRLQDEIAEIGWEFGDHATVVPNWVDPLPAWQQRHSYPEAAPLLRVMSAGQLTPHKGIDVIIEAARRLVDRGRTSFHVDLFGGGLVDHYRGLVMHHHLEDHVAVRGPLPQAQLSRQLWNHDVFVFPTWAREPFGFAPLEAAAHGCVPIVSRDCGYAEWGVDGVHMLKISRDPGELAAAVEAVLACRVDLRKLATRARRHVEQRFTVDHAAAAFERAADEVRGQAAVRPGDPTTAYHLARVAERLVQDWAETAAP